jgi:hypothetical protein
VIEWAKTATAGQMNQLSSTEIEDWLTPCSRIDVFFEAPNRNEFENRRP